MVSQKQHFRLLMLGCVSVGALNVQAHAADQSSQSDSRTRADIGEIVVTATRREESLSKVPLSIVATDQKSLDVQGVRSADDIMRLTPSITFGSSALFYGTGQSNIAIRGILSTSGIPTTGIYIDDTPIQTRTGISPSLTNAYPQIFDLDRVEVLRGPQGTLFGTGSMGGAIRFITPEPVMSGTKIYGRSELSTTQKGGTSYEAGIAGGTALIEGKLGFRASVSYRHDGGFVDRLDRYTKEVVERDINSGDSYVARVALGWKPAENVTITPSLFFQRAKLDDGAIFEPETTDLANVDYRTSYYVKPQYHTDRFILPALKAEIDLGAATLISNTSYFTRKTVTKSDDVALNIAIWSGYNGHFPPPDLPLVQSGTHNATSQKGITQELRLQSADADTGLSWVVGGFYSRFVTRDSFDAENLGLLDQINYGIINEGGQPVSSISDIFGVELYQGRYVISQHSKYTDTQKSLFAQVDYEVVPRVKLTAGLRYTATSFVYDNFLAGPLYTSNGMSETKLSKHNPITPKFGVSFQADSNNLFYASAAKGARGSNIADAVGFRCTPDGDILGFDPMVPRYIKNDSVWSYEVGSKNRLFDGRLAIDASAYHVDWKDTQTVIALPICQNHTIYSLGDAKIDGIDLALSAQPVDGLTLGVSVSYMNARYSSNLPGPNGTIVRRKGEPLDVAPWTYHLSGEYQFTMSERDYYLRADFTGSSHDDTPLDLTSPLVDPMIPRAPATAALGLRAGVRFKGFDVSLFANNVTNDNPILGLGHETPGNLNFRATAFRPRTIGLSATFRK